jgi:hypothetical protein
LLKQEFSIRRFFLIVLRREREACEAGERARAMEADAPFFSLPELGEGSEKNGAGADSATADTEGGGRLAQIRL